MRCPAPFLVKESYLRQGRDKPPAHSSHLIKNTTMRTIAALCVSGRSIYKHTAGVLAYDKVRDARTFKGGMPLVAHPPCRHWSKFLAHQAKAKDPAREMALGVWCVEQVLKFGGVLEHPAHSKLFEACQLPRPNEPVQDPFLYTVYVEQGWFGYASRKPTWVLVSGVPKAWLPSVPFLLGGGAKSIEGMSQFSRSRTVSSFADWLCQVARSTWWSMPEKTGCQDSGRFENRSSNRILERRFVPKEAPEAISTILCQSDRSGGLAQEAA